MKIRPSVFLGLAYPLLPTTHSCPKTFELINWFNTAALYISCEYYFRQLFGNYFNTKYFLSHKTRKPVWQMWSREAPMYVKLHIYIRIPLAASDPLKLGQSLQMSNHTLCPCNTQRTLFFHPNKFIAWPFPSQPIQKFTKYSKPMQMNHFGESIVWGMLKYFLKSAKRIDVREKNWNATWAILTPSRKIRLQ